MDGDWRGDREGGRAEGNGDSRSYGHGRGAERKRDVRAVAARPAGQRRRGPALRPLLAATISGVVAAHYVVLFVGSVLDVDTHGVLAPLDLFEERSAGTWVSTMLLAGVALAAAALAAASAAQPARVRRGWTSLAGLFALASFDEVAGVHESLVDLVRSGVALPGFLYYAAWVLPGMAVVAAFVVWQWRFFRRLPRWLRVRITAAAAVYVGAAAGLELAESALFASRGGREWTPLLQVVVGVEEGLEMAAAAVMLLALLSHLAERAPAWRLSVGVAESARLTARGEHLAVSPMNGPGTAASIPRESSVAWPARPGRHGAPVIASAAGGAPRMGGPGLEPGTSCL